MITVEPIPAFNDNYIWLISDDSSGEAVVVDPGDAGPVEKMLAERQLNLAALFITHHHADHTGGIPQLAERFDIEVFGPANSSIAGITQPLRDGDSLNILGHRFTVLEIPGHTLDHIAFFCESLTPEPALFCGDTLFSSGCGRVFEGTAVMMHRSLQRLAALPESSLIYCAHEYTQANLQFAAAVEPDSQAISARIEEVQGLRHSQRPSLPTSLAEEKRFNPFLRCDNPQVQAMTQSRHSETLDPSTSVDESEVFAILRSWKDTF